MQVDRQTLVRELISTISMVQEISGCDTVEIHESMVPLKKLIGFDSLRGVETTTILSQKLNLEVKTRKPECLNIFVSKDGRRALTVGETADRLIELLA